MTFGPSHYVPVLKVKRGEKAALRFVSRELRSKITPLLEIVARKKKQDKLPTVEEHLTTAFKDLAVSVRTYGRCFLDTKEIAPDGAVAAEAVFQKASSYGIIFTPVTGISRTTDVLAALNHRANGIALRLTRADLEGGHLTKQVIDFLAKHRLDYGEVDLIMDLGAVEDLVLEGVQSLTDAFLQEVPEHQRWKTMIVSACAFPSSLGRVDRNDHSLVERTEWKAWRANLHENRNSLVRLPTFSDCGIQHPQGVEDFDPRTMQGSAAIRYTVNENWLLIKGEGTRRAPPSKQFPDLATRLVFGRFREHYAGQHCAGCGFMRDAADGADGFGSLEAWRRLGTIHHIETVMRGLAALPAP